MLLSEFLIADQPVTLPLPWPLTGLSAVCADGQGALFPWDLQWTNQEGGLLLKPLHWLLSLMQTFSYSNCLRSSGDSSELRA